VRTQHPLGPAVDQERARLYTDLLDRAIPSQILLAAFGAYLLSPYVPLKQLALICGLSGTFLLLRRIVYSKLSRDELDSSRPNHANSLIGLFSLLNAVIIGGASAFWFSGFPLIIQLTVTVTLLGTYGLSIAVHHMQPGLMFCLGMAMLLPVAVAWRIYSSGAGTNLSIVLIGVPFLAWYTAAITRRAIDNAIQSRLREAEVGRSFESYSRELEAAVRAKNQFLAAAGHDLRQPLTSMQLLLSSYVNANPEVGVRKFAVQLQAPLDAMKTLLASLLEMSRLEAGLVQRKAVPVDLRALMLRIQIEYSPRAAVKRIDLRTVSPPLVVLSDPDLLERIVRNLVDNALKFTAQGLIEITASHSEYTCRISVRDTGIGISPELQHLVFDDYFQVSNPHRDRSQGLGLGLAIVRRQIHLLDGTISLSSTPGVGTVFNLMIPCSSTSVDHDIASTPRIDLAEALAGKERLLIVDDDRLILDALDQLLNSIKITKYQASNAQEALAVLKVHNIMPDIAILDYRLPGEVNGLELGRILIQRKPMIAVVIITADVDQSLASLALATGIKILHKPFAEQQLAMTISAARQSAVERLEALVALTPKLDVVRTPPSP
jgi:signal transduction histidine kinase/CheY-like chemotaxis protein